jgi:hypothetical protein
MEKSKLIDYLNKKYPASVITEIKRAIWDGEGDDKRLRLTVVKYNFYKDENSGGYHVPDNWSNIFIENRELKEIQREINIQSLLEEDEEAFNLEAKRYTPDQLKKLQELRDENKIKVPGVITKHDYYGSIKLGDKVWYKGEAGVVTFLHEPKKDGHLRFTVNVNGVETRYVNPFDFYHRGDKGLKLISKRKPKDYSNVEVPKKIKDKSTKELLSILSGMRMNSYHSYEYEQQVRAELSTREHVPNKAESKRNRTIAKKHGGSKSKSR